MTTFRALASRLGDGVQVRCARSLPAPVHGFVLAAMEQEEFSEYGPVVVFTLTVTGQGTGGQIDAELEAGTPEEWAALPILPPLSLRWDGTLEA